MKEKIKREEIDELETICKKFGIPRENVITVEMVLRPREETTSEETKKGESKK